MKLIAAHSIIIGLALLQKILCAVTRPYNNWNLSAPASESNIIPEVPQNVPDNEILYLLKRSSRNSSIYTKENLKFKINFPQVYKDFLINTTISVVPYHWDRIYNVSLNLSNAYPDVKNYFNSKDRLNMDLKDVLEVNKDLKCQFPKCKYSLLILSDRSETRSSIMAYNSNGDMSKNEVLTIVTKPGISSYGISESKVQDYLYPIIKWCVDKIPEGEIATGRFYADAELNATYSDKEINFYLNYVRAMLEREGKTDVSWENVRISTPEEKNMYILMSNPKDITTDDLDRGSFNTKSTMSKMDELIGSQSCKYACSTHGICLNGVCKCEDGYTGLTCTEKVKAYLFKEKSKENLVMRSLSSQNTTDYVDLKAATGNPNITGQNTHPCYSRGYLEYSKNVVGSGNYELCKLLISTLFFDVNCKESDPDCYKSVVKNKEVDFKSTNKIFAGKNYEKIGKMLNLSEITYSDYEIKAKWFCEIPYSNLSQYVSPEDFNLKDVATQCYNIVYQLLIFKSLGLPNNAIINFIRPADDPQSSLKWQINALVAEDSLKDDTHKTLNVPLVIIGALAIILYLLLRTQVVRKSLLRVCDPCIRRAKNREQADLRDKDADYFINTDLEKKDKSAVNIPAKKRQFVERKIQLRIVKYVFSPLEFLCLFLFLLGIYHLIAYVSHNVEAFLVLVVLSFSLILCGAMDIENDILDHEEPFKTVKNMKMHKEDVKLFMKLMENEENIDEECNLENALLRVENLK